MTLAATIQMPPVSTGDYYSSYRSNNGFLQVSHQTKLNRFPKIFETVKKLKPNPARILSFGCSTGEECMTLAKLFPKSEIVGIDIDHYTVQRARNNNKHPDRVFYHDQLGATGKYDLALCLMVLFCMQQPIVQDQFVKTLSEVSNHINHEGLLTVYTAEYDPKPYLLGYKTIKEWTRVHSNNKQTYFNGYYVKC